MRKALSLIIFLVSVSTCYGEWWNSPRKPFTNEPQVKQDSRTLKYNPYQRQWSYEAPDTVLKHNPYQNQWQYKPKSEEFKYNPYQNRWE